MTLRDAVLRTALTVMLLVLLAHPLFRFFDGRAVRRRLAARSPRRPEQRRDDSIEISCARFLDDVARCVRNQSSTAEALSLALIREPAVTALMAPMVIAVCEGQPVGVAAGRLSCAPPVVRRTALQIAIAATGGSLRPGSIERAAGLLRTMAAARADAKANVAHVTLSLRMLTVIPLLTIAVSLLAQDSARQVAIGSGAMASCLLAAVMLNVVGRAWMRRTAGDLA